MSPAQSDSKLSNVALRILAVLEDGDWHDLEELVDAVQYTIAPVEAFRFAQDKLGAETKLNQDDLIASGRRSKTIMILNNLVTSNRVERRGGKGRKDPKYFRLRESVPLVYVVRDAAGNLRTYVHASGSQHVSVHVLDAWATSTDPKSDAATVKDVLHTIPKRMTGRKEIEDVGRTLLNRYNVASVMQQADAAWREANPVGAVAPPDPDNPLPEPQPISYDETVEHHNHHGGSDQ